MGHSLILVLNKLKLLSKFGSLWPSGYKQILTDVDVNRKLVVTELVIDRNCFWNVLLVLWTNRPRSVCYLGLRYCFSFYLVLL